MLHRVQGGDEQRTVVSGSIDVLLLLPEPTTLFELPFANRLADVVPKYSVDSYSFEYYRQTARTNNAAPVADAGTKPKSTFTIEAVTGFTQIYATLSQPFPIRFYWHFPQLTQWLYEQSYGSVMDAVEADLLNGNGSAPHQTGITQIAGTTAVSAAGDLPTTLRSALTAMQLLGETPDTWVLAPYDAQLIDLTRWSTAGGFLSEGYNNQAGADRYGNSDNIFGPVQRRIIAPHLAPGTALLGDSRTLQLHLRDAMRLDIATTGAPTGTDLFSTNQIVFRTEVPVGIAITRPQSWAVISLPGGS